jgi:uncharacterized delta-60 repeat protein
LKGLARVNPDGTLDASFHPPDIPILETGEEVAVYALVLQSDGKIVVGGRFEAPAVGLTSDLVRLLPGGSPDPSFVPDIGALRGVLSLALQPDGKLLVGGGLFGDGGSGTGRRPLVRLNPDGTGDLSFHADLAADSGVWSLLLQPDGRILVGSLVSGPVRLYPNGSRDTTFSSDTGWCGSMALQPDGQLLIAGTFTAVNGIPRQGIARLNNDVVTPFVTRQLPYHGGATVRLVARPLSSVAAYAVQDQPPTGWLINNLSHGGLFDRVSGKVKFGPFFDAEQRTLTYDALPPTWGVHGLLGVFSFSGEASADGFNSPITGDQYLTVAGLFPADLTPADGRLSIAEVTAYGAAWRRGDRWPVNPNPIPIDYVTRAAALWRGGESYTVDRRVTIEPLWWVNCSTGALHVLERDTLPPALGCAATRRLPPTFVPAEPFIVTITALPATGISAYALEEQVPPGWTVTNVSSGGELDAMNGNVKWGPFFDHVARSLSYQAVPPADAQAGGLFAGMASFDGASIPVAGATQSRPSCRLAAEYRVQAGILQLSLTGLAGARFEIEASSDLRTWAPLMTVTNAQGSVHISDAEANRWQQRFYRARLIE